jgi:hypothetical protein
MTPDEIITKVTQAPTDGDALVVMNDVRSRKTLLAVADQLYIDAIGKSSDSIRKAIVSEARS